MHLFQQQQGAGRSSSGGAMHPQCTPNAPPMHPQCTPPKNHPLQIFHELVDLDPLLSGIHTTIFAYGVTGSGKTHTMLGDSIGVDEGIMPRTIRALFEEIERRKGERWVVWAGWVGACVFGWGPYMLTVMEDRGAEREGCICSTPPRSDKPSDDHALLQTAIKPQPHKPTPAPATASKPTGGSASRWG